MRPLHIIMPMAGEGSRFIKGGFDIPKPLIKLNDKMLFERAVSSIDSIVAPKKYTFIVRSEHIEKFQINKKICSLYKDANIFSVTKTTRGAVETVLLARDLLSKDDSVLIMDCDLEFHSSSFNNYILKILNQPVSEVNGGALVSFTSDDKRYSYALIDSENRVIRTAEKEVISNHALAGAYFFSNSESLFYAADKLVENSINFAGELYVSLLYNYLIQRGDFVSLLKSDKFFSYGTPDELGSYL